MFNIKVLFKFKTINYLASISLNIPSTTIVVTSDTSIISKYIIMHLMLLTYLTCNGV